MQAEALLDAVGAPAPDGAPLASCCVLDLTDARGMLAGHLLAQLGADVIQIEPPSGSPARGEPPFARTSAESLFWSAYGAGKRGITLDITSAEGRDLLLDLARHADVLIESHDPGQMAEFGLGPDALREANSRLIHVSITAFGSDGPKAGYAASDLIVWASSGGLEPHRAYDGTPLRISVPQAFRQASVDAAGGALIALLACGEEGPGQHVDVSVQASCMLCTMSSHLADAVNHPDFNLLGGSQSKELLALSGSDPRTRKTKWEVRDGLVELRIGMGTAGGRFANALFAWLASIDECPEPYAGWDWVQMPQKLLAGQITADDLRGANRHVADVLKRFSKADILAAAQEHGLPMAPVMTTADLMESPHLAARGFHVAYGPDGYLLPAPFAHCCGPPPMPRRAAPRLGEHNREVYGALLGLRDDVLGGLAQRGIV